MAAEEEPPRPHPTFWQQPWVQTVLPFLTSLALHAGIIVIGLATMAAYVEIVKLRATENQINAAESGLAEDMAMGVTNPGLGGDHTRPAAQDEYPDQVQPGGWAIKPGNINATPEQMGGGSGESGEGDMIRLGMGGIGIGKGLGSGKGSGSGAGTGTGEGPLAPFGAPGGGGLGPQAKLMGVGSPARTVVFVCDASGSMMNKMETLRQELDKGVSNLKASQQFNVIFFQDEKFAAAFDGLVPATAANKRKSREFLSDVETKSTSDPIPGLEAAFRSKPQLMFILTDGEFQNEEEVLQKIKALNGDGKTTINTIAFVSDADGDTAQSFIDFLSGIAKDSNGKFQLVKEESLQ